ncbi:MAG: hypothetical protein SVN78_05565 [Deferribacterota bacterium]|nr:hypothetical protein [Deferribacterota bacterium]
MLTSREREITKDLILGKKKVELSSFAFKIFLQQLHIQTNLGADSDINKLVDKVDDFLEKNKRLPNLWKDFEKIYGRKMNEAV